MKKRINLYLYTVIVILIFTHGAKEILKTQRYFEKNASFEFRIWQFSTNCWYYYRTYIFQLNSCKDYQKGSVVKIFSRGLVKSANEKNELKRLDVYSINLIKKSSFSVSYWFDQLIVQILAKKEYFLNKIIGFLNPLHFQIVKGMIFGSSDFQSASLSRKLNIIGMTHVISASGFNLTVITSLVFKILSKFFSRRWQILLSIGIVWIYSISATLAPSIVRAAAMLTWSLMAKLSFRRVSLEVNLLISTLLLLVLEPFFVQNLSFQLSVLATLSISLFFPILMGSESFFFRSHQAEIVDFQVKAVYSARLSHILSSIVNHLQESFFLTLAAQILVLPLVILNFSQLSLLSLVANTGLLWLTPIITIFGLIFIILVNFLEVIPIFGQLMAPILALLVAGPIELFLKSVNFLSQFEQFLIELSLSKQLIVVWWLGCLFFVCWWRLKPRRSSLLFKNYL